MKTRQTRSKLEKTPSETLDACFPSVRYFQVHFEYLYETIEELKQQVAEANQQIAMLQQQLQTQSLDEVPNLNFSSDAHPGGDLRQT